MLKIRLVVCFVLFVMVLQVGAQSNKQKRKDMLGKGPNDFPELVQPNIPGAPKLGKPQLIMGETTPVWGGGMGWAAPAVWDWDEDGKQDLLIGEFASGYEHGHASGHYIRVYRNIGENNRPEFSDEFQYADYVSFPRPESPNGTPISVNSFCCLGFTPQFVDLDNDGLMDLISGQYNPGEVTWFRNMGSGFQAGVKLPQAGDPSAEKDITLPSTDPNSWRYWNYSSANFGDFDEDGDQDLITGGTILRISENIGTKTSPRFGPREPLLDVNGNKLKIYRPTTEEREAYPDEDYSGACTLTVPLVVDWDQDGVLDLMVTAVYARPRQAPVTFFRGVKTSKGHRFEPGIPLFSVKNGGKAFPGAWLRAYVTDWNNDGISDLLIGTSVATLNRGKFDHNLSWRWENDTKISKLNPGLGYEYGTLAYAKQVIALVKKDPKFTEEMVKIAEERHAYILNGGDPSLVHQGYVYVMLGEK